MKLLASLLALVLVAPLAQAKQANFQVFQPAPDTVSEGRCHMDGCAWVKWLGVLPANRINDREVRLSARVLVGFSDNNDTMAGKPKIEWDPTPQTTMFMCSYSRPSVLFTSEDGPQEHLLSLAPDGIVYGYMQSSAQMYFQACHSSSLPVNEAVAAFGYSVIQEPE